ncbi:MAG TPA: hypothetical protein PKE04_04125, partial [Clostridia bacterium]|nr:hypothetical protein [Clostridia bacterium]
MKRTLTLLLCACLLPGLMSAPAGAEPTKITMIVSLPAEYQEDNPIVPEINRLANVELELIVPPSTGYVEKRNMMLASGSLPDVVMFENIDDKLYQAAVRDGTLI